MAETKKTKKSSTKKTTSKASATKKTTTKKTVKKQAPKKNVTKKVAPKKVETKKVEPKETKPVEKQEELEKTIIFDGRQNKNLSEVVNKLEEDNVIVEDKVIKRSKDRKIAIIILAIIMLLVFSATTAYVISTIQTDKHNSETKGSNVYKKVSHNTKDIKPVEEHDEGEDYEHIKTITLTEFENKILEKEDMTVLVASQTCAFCVVFEPVIEEVYKNLDDEIYRVDIANFSKDEVSRFRTYYAFTVTPTIFVIKDGVVTADITGRRNQEDLTEWVKENA